MLEHPIDTWSKTDILKFVNTWRQKQLNICQIRYCNKQKVTRNQLSKLTLTEIDAKRVDF